MCRLCDALVRVLDQRGPTTTAFGASPACTFVCNGTRRDAKPGWWLCYACATEIDCRSKVGHGVCAEVRAG